MEWIGCTVCEITPLDNAVTLKLGFGITQGYRKWHYSIEHMRFYIRPIVNMPLSINVYEIRIYCSKIATPLYSARLLGVKPSDLRNNPW